MCNCNCNVMVSLPRSTRDWAGWHALSVRPGGLSLSLSLGNRNTDCHLIVLKNRSSNWLKQPPEQTFRKAVFHSSVLQTECKLYMKYRVAGRSVLTRTTLLRNFLIFIHQGMVLRSPDAKRKRLLS